LRRRGDIISAKAIRKGERGRARTFLSLGARKQKDQEKKRGRAKFQGREASYEKGNGAGFKDHQQNFIETGSRRGNRFRGEGGLEACVKTSQAKGRKKKSFVIGERNARNPKQTKETLA